MIDSPFGEARLLTLRQINDIRIALNGGVDIVGHDESGAEIVIRIGPYDLELISKALANRAQNGWR